MITGKTISQLDLLTDITSDTSIPVELSGNTYHVQYSSIKPYKVYTALLTQTGTDDPVAIVLENTLGSPVTWKYNGTGEYIFDISINIFNSTNTAVLVSTILGFSEFAIGGPNVGKVYTYRSTTAIPQNDILNNTPVEIRVYN